ncbi:translation factor SUA5 [Desulfonispora thiosulfatigenes DSM 11270]|uniref:Threonylcarbamoyl-AMP synthase n=1 Tax=Desulfonispora thiosulfatigenes DSM 11270 TaxID=656914 RepID=A0A1W1V4F2_DESTI|nr:L-threonylcarbamoyladenylate synthase [Desulfonispora thiosulfatigenes]SMB88163.1 translation factor SUA5 [Desulfonispora thiosulfatigenes DSM 11270]
MKILQTYYWKTSVKDPDESSIEIAADLLKKGEIIGFPTETVYGLGANGLDEKAIEKIYRAKGRPSDNPLILHIDSEEMLKTLVTTISAETKKIIREFWPGPLTLVLPKSKIVPSIITAGLDTVAVRMPAHKVALKLIKKTGLPIAAPSANLSGKPSPTTAEHVWHDLAGKIAGIIDAGPTGIGVESTVLDLSGEIPTILRPGGVTREQLRSLIGRVEYDPALKNKDELPRSPGMKYTHYSPDAEVILVSDIAKLHDCAQEDISKGLKVGLMISEEGHKEIKDNISKEVKIEKLGSRKRLEEATAQVYGALRKLDGEKVNIIYVEMFPEEGIGVALMNRLIKAAGEKQV